MITPQFDFNEAVEQLQSGKGLTGPDGVLTPLIKQLTEAALKAELDLYLAQASSANRKNGHTKKTVKCGVGEFELETPRDRDGLATILRTQSLAPLHLRQLLSWRKGLAPSFWQPLRSLMETAQ